MMKYSTLKNTLNEGILGDKENKIKRKRKIVTVKDNTYIDDGAGKRVKAPWMDGDLDMTKTTTTPRKTKTIRDYSYNDSGQKKIFREIKVTKKGRLVKDKKIDLTNKN